MNILGFFLVISGVARGRQEGADAPTTKKIAKIPLKKSIFKRSKRFGPPIFPCLTRLCPLSYDSGFATSCNEGFFSTLKKNASDIH